MNQRDRTNRPAFRGIIFEVTSRCNLSCGYCYNIHKGPLGISAADGGYGRAKAVLKQLFRVADVERVTMSGGEPFMQDRFLELVLYCRMKGKRVVIITNGTKGTDEEYKQLVSMGVTLFELPLHSTVPNDHDDMTGVPGSHTRVLSSIQTLRALGAKVVPVIVVTKRNADRIQETLRFLKELGLPRIMMNRFNIGGSGIANAKALSLSIAELRQVFHDASDTAVRLNLNLSSNVCSPVCVLDGRDFPGIRYSRCSPDMSRRSLTMDLAGNLRFCNHSPINMGNIYTDEIRRVVSSDYAAGWKQRPTFCAGCDKWTRCFGGCRAASEQLGQSVLEVDPILQPLDFGMSTSNDVSSGAKISTHP